MLSQSIILITVSPFGEGVAAISFAVVDFGTLKERHSRELFCPRISVFYTISVEGFFAEKPNGAKSSTNSERIDLTLKLSPCGQNAGEKWLTRSSSIAIAGEKAKSTVADGPQWGPSVPSLDRSFSLPAEAEKGLMRFGDLQTMRRVKTGKRLLQEKQRRAAATETEKPPAVSPRPPAGGQPPVSPEVLGWAAASSVKSPSLARPIDKLKTLANPSGDSRHEDTFTGGSCSIPSMGPRGSAEGEVSSNFQTSSKQENDSMVSPKTMVKEMPLRPAGTKLESPTKKLNLVNPCSLKGDAMDILRQMPSVTTTGDGPSGKRIEGFLYKYRGGQVCIVCVCHGSFLSPAEFVIHAGGKEVANPMKHITVCSNSF